MAKRGISLLDLAAPFPGAQALVPGDLAARLENFAVISHRSTVSAGAVAHSGVIQPIADLGFPSLRNWNVEVPGLNSGLPFRLVRTRATPGSGQNLEPAGSSAFVDLFVDRIAVEVPGLRPATLVPTAPASVAHLVPDTTRSGVKIVGSGVVRIDLSGAGDLVRFVDWPDPFDPLAPSGAVYRVTFSPVSFFIGGSEIGMVVDRLVYDASSQVTPPEIIARGQTPGWEGISIAEATLLLPPDTPLVDKITIGVKDVLLGSPAGLQGQIRVELGRTPINAAAVDFLQDFAGAEQPRPVSGSGRELTVPFLTGTPGTGRIRAKLNPAALGAATHPHMAWTLPDGSTAGQDDSGWFTTSVGETMSGTFSEEVNGEQVFDAPTSYTFVQSEPGVQRAAKVNVHVGAVDIANVVSVSGTQAALNLLEFESALNPADAADLRWQYGEGADASTKTGPDFVLLPSADPGTSYIVVTDAQNRARRIRVDVLDQGGLLVGAADGVHDAVGALVPVRGVEQTYDLSAFHKDASLTPFSAGATLSGGAVTVPAGGLAEVTVELGHDLDPGAPPPPVTESDVRRLEIRFDFGLSNPVAFGKYVPRTQENTVEASVRAWAQFFPGATLVVIGRCCDISSDSFNAALATDRANAVAAWLPAGSTLSRGEQTAPSGAMAAAQNQIVPPLSPAEMGANRLITIDFTEAERKAWGDVASNPHRQEYRRADIFAVGGTYTPPSGADPADQKQPTDTQQLDPALRRGYVPGDDTDAVVPPEPRDPRLAFLVRLAVTWDSPTVTEWADAIPTQAEFTVEWATTNVQTIPAPGGGDSPVPVRAPSEPKGQPSTEVYTLTGRWSYDSRSGQTVFSLSIASSGDPKGLAAVDSEFLAIAMALAPALLAGIGASGVDGAAVRIAALAIAAGVLSAVAKDGEVVIHSAEIEHRQRSLTDATGFRTRVLLDYTAAVGFDIAAAGLGSIATDDGHPLKVRYKKVGLELDDSKTEWYEKVGLVYEDVSFEVSDPGRWKIDGPLGQLLQIAATRAGVGSTWFECDLEFALDLGVVSVNGATVRCTFGDGGFSAELRGLGLGVDIPGVLRGEGRLVLGDGGAFKAAIELDLVTVGAKAMGALAFDPASDFLSIALGLVLPVGIPLGATGLGIFGFIGLFVSNGARALPPGFDDDPVGREIKWFRDTPYEDKFAPLRGQWAIGLGMIVGTLPDSAFTFNATGMFVVAFPDPTVIFGIDAKLIKKPAAAPSTQGAPADPSLSILGLVAIDDEAVAVGVRGTYTIPKVLEFLLPIDGYFPYPATPKDAYVRIGSDGVVSEGRPGDPVTIKVLPGTLSVSAFSYLMIEEKKLHRLGNDPQFNFDGFCVGFGAGWQINWSAGPIKLDASAKILVGFGTNPFLLKGGISVKGELSLVVVSVSARGSIVATVWDDGGVKVNLKGQFCGSVSFFFFSVEGCVGIEIGDPITPDAPPPPPPLGKVSLTDRRGFTTAVATAGMPGEAETVWPDTVPVIEFTHHLGVSLSGGAFDPGPGPAGPAWSGTSELKYAYRLTGVEIVPDGGGALAGPLDCGWWLPTSRPGVLADGDVAVSESEGMFLALLSWDPAPWSYWLTGGGAGTDGDPAQTLGRLCDPPSRPSRGCALGKLAVRTGPDAVRFPPADLGSPPFPSRFTMEARERAFGMPLASVVPFLAQAGLAVTPGHVGSGVFGDDVWWLTAITQHSFTARTAELYGRLAPEIVDADLLLVVCRDFRRRPPGGPRVCAVVADYFGPDQDLGTANAIGPVKIASKSGPMQTVGGKHGAGTTLHWPGDGMTFFLPEPTDRVVLTIQPLGSPARASALDERGTEVATGSVSQGPDPVDIVLSGQDIASVELTGGAFEDGVVRICWGTAGGPAGSDDATTGPLPTVAGTLTDGGDEQEWTPKVEQQVQTAAGLCSLVRYVPPDEEPGTTARWSSLRIREWLGTGKADAGRMGLVRVCGVSGSAWDQAQGNDAFAAWLLAAIDDRVAAAEPARKDLLAANRSYQVNVSWQWQGWVKSDSQPQPPAVPPAGGWHDGPVQTHRFRTAATAVTSGAPPAELTDEHAFDPRSLLRYLIAFDPETNSAPHLLDDVLLVHLAVDHADQLAGLYGRHLQLRLRRTDPPPGSLAGQDHPANEAISVVWGKLYDAYRPLGQARFLQAVREAPCLQEPGLGGTTGEVTADLVPGAWYDLMLMATPTAQPDSDDVVVARTHFQASRYRDESDLLGALGFGVPGPTAFIAPDALVTAAVPGGALAVGDSDLDAALAAAGLDPWPLSDQARTSILWLDDAGTWQLAGLLLEAPEPIVRTGRTALDVTACHYGGLALSQRCRNLAGTRVLLTPPAPVTVPAADAITLTVTRTVTDRTGATSGTAVTGRRFAIEVPRSVRMEVGT
jgi:hypothetical protein